MSYRGTHRKRQPFARRLLPRAAAASAIVASLLSAPLATSAAYAGINPPGVGNPCGSVCDQLVTQIQASIGNLVPEVPPVPDPNAVITAIEACTGQSSTSSPNDGSIDVCKAVGFALSTINATLGQVPGTVQQVETITTTLAMQTIASVLTTYEQCADGTNPVCASVLQTVSQTLTQVVALATQEVNFLAAYVSSCIAGSNPTCNSLIADVQNLVIEAEQELAFVTATATTCISGQNPTCAQLLAQVSQRISDIEGVLASAEQCIQGADGTTCQAAEQAAGQIIASIATTLAGLLGQVTECVSGQGPTCQLVQNEVQQLATTVETAINGCVAQDPASACEMVVSQLANALNFVEGTAISCSGIEDDANCAALESATMPVLRIIGSQDVNAGVVDASADASTGDIGVGFGGSGENGMAASSVTPPMLPGPVDTRGLPATPLVWINTFDTPADALAAGDLNEAATASNQTGGCASSNDGLAGPPDYVYPPQPAAASNKNVRIQYNSVMYQKNHARTEIDPTTGVKALTWQIDDCVYGEGRSYNHNNLWLSAGSSALWVDPNQTDQIGYAWQSGTSVTHPSMTLDFKLSLGKATIGGNVGSHPNGSNNGAVFNPPPYFNPQSDAVCVKSCDNEVTGWWKQEHAWYDCKCVWGSNSSQGTTFGGLFEFSEATQPSASGDVGVYYWEYCYWTRGCH